MDIFDAPFYWGRLSRQDAEEVLDQLGLTNGLFLVREKLEDSGVYAISLCCAKRLYHYRIDRLPNDNVILNGSRTQEKLALPPNESTKSNRTIRGRITSEQLEFRTPMELICYFQKNADPLVTALTTPCQRPFDHNFVQFWCISYLTPEIYVRKIVQEATNADLEIPIKQKLTYKRYIYERKVTRTLHENELWFHSRIGRQEAESRLKQAGAKNGLFLVREKQENHQSFGSFTLSLCFQREFHHYIVRKKSNNYFQVASMNKSARISQFGSLSHLIDFYHRYHQDLACPLQYPCNRPGGSVRILPYDVFLEISSDVSCDDENGDSSPLARMNSTDTSVISSDHYVQLPKDRLEKQEPNAAGNGNIFIDEKYIILGDKLGEGQFGEVYIGKLIGNDENNNGIANSSIQDIAIKRLRHTESSCINDLYGEGERMLQLDHPYIVKLFGICKHETMISLILELCPYGAMNHWLRSNKTFRMDYIINYMYQVSDGMSYLHEKNIIHRDLALRNILITSKTVCKISDFGLSRDLGDSNYYQLGNTRRLPSMWYPPEVLETPLFHSNIDIWSFGVTVWEATSYGQTPYRKELEAMQSSKCETLSQRLLKFLSGGNRLKQPPNCPDKIYDLMLKCWEYDKHKRPTFASIKNYLMEYAHFEN